MKNFADYLKSVQAELQKTRSKQKFGARSWGYFLEDGIHVSKGDFDAVEDAIGDARKLGFIPILGFIAEDQDETRRFSGLLTAVNPAEYLQDPSKRKYLRCLIALLNSILTSGKAKNTF